MNEPQVLHIEGYVRLIPCPESYKPVIHDECGKAAIFMQEYTYKPHRNFSTDDILDVSGVSIPLGSSVHCGSCLMKYVTDVDSPVPPFYWDSKTETVRLHLNGLRMVQKNDC